MITLLGTLLGFFSSSIPELIKLFKDKSDKKHELAILDRQMDLQKAGLSNRLEEININADIAETIALHTPQIVTGVAWADALSASVRPFITYMFMAAYLVVKVGQYQILENTGDFTVGNFSSLISLLWSQEDEAIFATILGFWFGGRVLEKMQKRK
jgi:hypothetical protein